MSIDASPESRAAALLRHLVEIESPTGDRAGIGACLRLIDRWTAPLLGRPGEIREIDGVEHLYSPTPRPGGVLLLGHADTVWPRGTLDELPFRLSEGRASGPGTFDMKAGIVAMAGALERTVRQDRVSLLITGDEETGSRTSRALIEEAAGRAEAVLISEPSLEGAVKVARRGAGIYELRALGRAAHAGLEPELGANALIEISHQVLRLARAADAERGTTVTPTVAHAGTTVNTVPDRAEVHVDVRAWSLEELQRVDRLLHEAESSDPRVSLSLSGGINRPPMPRERTQHLYELARETAASLGLPALECAEVGGGSDGNFTAALGVSTLDGLGPLGDGAHAPHEWVDIASIVERSRLIGGLLDRLTADSEPLNDGHDAVMEGNSPR